MKSWLDRDIEDLADLVDEYCDNIHCTDCVFYSRPKDCLGDISIRLNITLDLINKCKKELSQYV